MGMTRDVVAAKRRLARLPKVLMFSDNKLPPGWVRKLKQRENGKQVGRWDVYIVSPTGRRFASRKQLKVYFQKKNLNLNPKDFNFTPYQRIVGVGAANMQSEKSDASTLAVASNSAVWPTGPGCDGSHAATSVFSAPALISANSMDNQEIIGNSINNQILCTPTTVVKISRY